MSEVVEKNKLEKVLEKLQTLPAAQQRLLISRLPKDEGEVVTEILDELNTRKLRVKAGQVVAAARFPRPQSGAKAARHRERPGPRPPPASGAPPARRCP